MWQPEPGWESIPGAGPSTVGVWSTREQGREVAIKRIAAPAAHDDPSLLDPQGPNYWRRAADVALSGVVAETPGLREPQVVRVEEDQDGITLIHAKVPRHDNPGLWLAACIGRFAAADVGSATWLTRGQLRHRLALVARRGGWNALARTQIADVADHLWTHRDRWLNRLDSLPQVAQHGDTSAANIPGREGDDGIAVDWSHLGVGPVGGDIGYLSLSMVEDFEHLLRAYTEGLPQGLATPDEVRMGAQVTAVYTALTRVDWALARVADGEGALAGKFRHPSVAPYIRAMQRQVDQIEALLA